MQIDGKLNWSNSKQSMSYRYCQTLSRETSVLAGAAYKAPKNAPATQPLPIGSASARLAQVLQPIASLEAV